MQFIRHMPAGQLQEQAIIEAAARVIPPDGDLFWSDAAWADAARAALAGAPADEASVAAIVARARRLDQQRRRDEGLEAAIKRFDDEQRLAGTGLYEIAARERATWEERIPAPAAPPAPPGDKE